MEVLPNVAAYSRNFAVMVRSLGPDPKGFKMRNHPFHLHQTGITTLSASGILLPAGCLSTRPPIFDHVCGIHGHHGHLVVTTASLVEPFLSPEYRNKATQEFSPKLISSAHVDVLVEGEERRNNKDHNTNPLWHSCKILALVDVTASSIALQSLVGGENILQSSSWDVGFSFASRDDNNETMMVKSISRIAILGVSGLELKNILPLNISQDQQRGDLLLAMGSPFGIMSPLHFLNSVSFGTVANCCSSCSVQNSLLLVDIRGLPGMEGGPVFDRHACLIGMLTCPLRQKNSNTEIQLVITWNAITIAWRKRLQESQDSQQELTGRYLDKESSVLHDFAYPKASRCLPEIGSLYHVTSLGRAMSSIVLISVGGSWASGTILNRQGLILTNAHVLEPWRFVGKSLVNLMKKRTAILAEDKFCFSEREEETIEQENRRLLSSVSGTLSSYGVVAHGIPSLGPCQNYGKISVRLHHMGVQFWSDATVVYVSKGPLDVALLQLDCVSSQLCAINPEFNCPSIGLPVHVIGHGLFGPQSDLCSSVSTGVVSHVVRLPGPFHIEESGNMEIEKASVPVMLQTTAAVHPGASGGAVVNSDGHMIGLITSNAKHGDRSTIPHLNFCIPCAALLPIFRFSDERNFSILKVLDEPNDLLSSVWALLPPSELQNASDSHKNNHESKGSRFSKFLAEKHLGVDAEKGLTYLIKDKPPSKM
ncbi:glyoxysomal processing protease, glyoxysomal-like isoform X2 [Zingiber officinale]|uniref:glyoxysomal processing protease, glyoxysomal-like isoform X2 n=1 Tax=Zingiber officinale TaxID=94328 RepID=UPI001C4B05F3|nr:glyoxysomal processing protease, glyoxysomal-like isoform X2 [Zingiber officinale]